MISYTAGFPSSCRGYMLPSELASLSVESISSRGFKVIENEADSLHIVFDKNTDIESIAKSIVEILHLCGGVQDYGTVVNSDNELELWINSSRSVVA